MILSENSLNCDNQEEHYINPEIEKIAEMERDRIERLLKGAIANIKKGERKGNQHYSELSTIYNGYLIEIYNNYKENEAIASICNLLNESTMRDEQQLVLMSDGKIHTIYTWGDYENSIKFSHSFRIPVAIFFLFKSGITGASCEHYGVKISHDEFLKRRAQIVELNKKGKEEKDKLINTIKFSSLLQRALYRQEMKEDGLDKEEIEKYMNLPMGIYRDMKRRSIEY